MDGNSDNPKSFAGGIFYCVIITYRLYIKSEYKQNVIENETNPLIRDLIICG